MKKLFLLSTLLLSVIYLNAQPALKYARPPYGTQKTYGMYAGAMTDPLVGANQVWDYSTLKVTAIGSGVYTDPNTLPASAKDKFPTATCVVAWNMGTTLDKTAIDYYLESADSTVALGQQHSGGSNFHTLGYVIGVWGLSFGESKNARTQNAMTGKLELSSFKYAGYGTLKTANGTYNNVVMIKNGTHVYFYQTSPYSELLMDLIYSGPATIAGAYIYSYVNVTSSNQLSDNEMKVFPNPTSGQLTIDLSNQQVTSVINLFNENGQSVLHKQVEGPIVHLDLKNNARGIYILRITSSATTTFRKIVLK